MTYPDLFAKQECKKAIARIENITSETKPEWGMMNAAQMLAHVNVAYEFVYDPGKYKRPTGIKRFFIKRLIKPFVVGPKPYKRNAQTAPEFKAASVSNAEFDSEKTRLIDFIEQVQRDGVSKFLTIESHSFGLLTEQEWNTLFSKHLEHHLVQFGV
jgi:hypothetical protein|tara:strand:+ start:494 stop:961 length:468 start_codon:yes stop_codon:yes gene_type:complete